MRRFLLARHAESELGARGLVDGDPARANPLTATGREQAARLRARLEGEPFDLCVTTRLQRTRETADLALEGREVPRLVVPELDEITFGRWEERPFEEYAVWAWAAGPAERAPGEGESRREVAARIAAGWRVVLERPEQTVLAVVHGLTVRYTIDAAQGLVPAQRAEQVGLAEPYELSERELRTAADTLARWSQDPAWRAG
jgi:2,3-bisphosphoglycerate-dependent phosphoglycerate mutase